LIYNLRVKKILIILFISLSLIGAVNAASSNVAYEAYENEDYQTAFKEYSDLAKTGDLNAQEWLGYLYEYGEGVAQDYKLAFSWYQKAADRGSDYAQSKLGALYQYGRGVTKDYKQAVKWYQKSADQGDSFAQRKLGYMYDQGLGVTKDSKQAVKWYQKSANQEDDTGQGSLGYMYEMGRGVTKDYKQAVKWYQKSADQGNAVSQSNLANMYEWGRGVTKDYKQAFSLYQKSADQGNAVAQSNLGEMYEDGKGVTQNDKLAVSWYQKSADQGNESGQRRLGWMYEKGRGVTQDYKQAIKWYQKSADQGYSYAQGSLALMYEYGRGVTKDYKQAVKWYQKSANLGNEVSQNNLGYMYEWGRGVTKDYKQAVKWYQKSADQGYKYGQGSLGYMYEHGRGVTQDYKQAVSWYQKSANQGNATAQKNLGEMYEDGKGVTQNDKLALSWYRKAANQDNSIAKKNLNALELKISTENTETASLTCNSGYIKRGKFCRENIKNGYWTYDGSTMKCYVGYKKAGASCKKESEIIVTDNVDTIASSNSSLEDNAVEVEFWRSIQDSIDTDEYLIYLKKYPEGYFAELAKLRISKKPASTPSIPNIDYGNYHALVIGNDNYRHLSPLSNAVNDANDVADLLTSKYQFNVNLLTNATRDEIVSALYELSNSIASKDNLLVYYAGHGYLDTAIDEGFWLPIDAENDNKVHWVANHTIMQSIRSMDAKHVMVVADSCFSGSLTRGVNINLQDSSPDYINQIAQKKSRTVLTSGGLEPVSDVGGGGNSVFAAIFLSTLNSNEGVLDGNQLFSKIRQKVILNSDQTPEYGNIRRSGHEGGDFLFVRQ